MKRSPLRCERRRPWWKLIGYCLVSVPVPESGPQGPVRVQLVTVSIVPSVEKVPRAVTLFVVTGSA